MDAGKLAGGIGRVNLDLDSRGAKLCSHFVQIPDAKVQHPDLLGIPEIFARLRKRREGGGACLLLPNGIPFARWQERDSQVLSVPKPQRFRIFGSKEESSDSGDFFHFRFSCDRVANGGPRRERGGLWRYGCLRRYGELVSPQDEVRPESK